MKHFLFFLSFIFFVVISQSLGQIDADILIKRQNGADNTGWLAMTNNGDGTYSYLHTFPLAVGSGYFVIVVRKIDKSGPWVTTYHPSNAWHTSWVYTTSDEQTINLQFNTNDLSGDGWSPSSDFCYADDFTSWATVNDGANQ